ncbi:MAG: hypothetical protein ACRDO1_10970, partial [Nocardioidaceae bacterium]
DEVGREVAVRGYRRFWRVPGFDGMDQEPADWAGCVDRSVAHLLAPARDEVEEYERDDPRSAWTAFEDSVTGMRGRIVYPALHHTTFIMVFLAYAERWPDRTAASAARRQAVEYGGWLLDHSLPADWRCGGLAPSTVDHGEVGGGVEGESITLFRQARAAEAYLLLAGGTGDARFTAGAERVAAVLLDLQRDDGSWPFRVDPRTGDTTEDYTSASIGPIRLFRLLEDTGVGSAADRAAWREARVRAEHWLLAGPISDGRWEGMYEDIPGLPAWSNLQNWDTNETIRYLCSDGCDLPDRIDHARRLNAYIEDQFVVWAAEDSPVGVRCLTPSVLEQYRCFWPMEVHTGHWLMSLLALHHATGEKHYLSKGVAAANAIAAGQVENGALSTWGFDRRFGTTPMPVNWPGCNAFAAHALLRWQEYYDAVASGRDYRLGSLGL